MRFNPRMKVERIATESYNVSLPVPLKKEVLDLRQRADKLGYDWNAIMIDVWTQFVEEFKTELKNRGKTQDKGQAKAPGEVILANGQP